MDLEYSQNLTIKKLYGFKVVLLNKALHETREQYQEFLSTQELKKKIQKLENNPYTRKYIVSKIENGNELQMIKKEL